MERKIDIDNLTQDDFMEMAKYCHHLELQNGQLLDQLREAKAMLTATVQQRNSLNIKLQTLLNERNNTIDITAMKTEVVNSNIELMNPEQYREKKQF